MYIWYDDRFTQMKRSNAHEVTSEQFWDVVHVFMSSFSETADAENTASSTRFSMYVCSNENRRLSFITKMQNMQDSYLNRCFAA